MLVLEKKSAVFTLWKPSISVPNVVPIYLVELSHKIGENHLLVALDERSEHHTDVSSGDHDYVYYMS